MFNDIGDKIKITAKILTVLGIIFSIIYACFIVKKCKFAAH